MHPSCADPDTAWSIPTTIVGRRDHLHALRAARDSEAEAWIERVQDRGDCVVVTLLLDDGSPAFSVLGRDEADWLELRPGQIVSLVTDVTG